MATSLRFTFFLGISMLACGESGPEAGATGAGSGGSAGGAPPGPASASAEVGTTASSSVTSTSLTGSGGSQTAGTSGGSITSSATLTGVGGTSASTSSGGTGGSDSGGSDSGGSDSGGTGPAAGGTATDAGGSAGSAGNASGGSGGSGAGGTGGTSDPLESFTLAVVGSSTAAGEGASSSSRGWVNLLANEMEDSVLGDFVSRNLSVGGYATSNLMPGSSSNGNIDDAIDEAPNLIIVALAGSNDLSNGVSTETFLERLATIRETALNAGVPVFFMSTAPKDLSDDEQEALLAWTNQMREEFDSCWTPVTASYSPCFIDVFEALANSSLGIADEYGSGDGIHLNDAGHQRIFEIAASVVQPYVCSLTECTQ